MTISQKIRSGQNQPNAGNGIVSIGGSKGLGASGHLMANIQTTCILSPFPPFLASQLDIASGVLNNRFGERFDEVNYYFGSGTKSSPA